MRITCILLLAFYQFVGLAGSSGPSQSTTWGLVLISALASVPTRLGWDKCRDMAK